MRQSLDCARDAADLEGFTARHLAKHLGSREVRYDTIPCRSIGERLNAILVTAKEN